MRKTVAVVIVAALGVSLPRLAAAEDQAKEGEAIFKKSCAVCHSTEAGQNKIGPSLDGIVGRKAASAPGFSYSEAMKKSGITWDEATLDKYLADPRGFLPGNKMIFPGLKKPEERQALIAYLKTQD